MTLLPFHPLFGILISILMLGGTIFFGQVILKIIGHQNSIVLSLGMGMILISQALYICTFNKISILIIYPTAICLILLGSWYLFIKMRHIRTREINLIVRKISLIRDPLYILSISLMIVYLLLSIAPPTNADALDYHWGVPMYLLYYHEWPATHLWRIGSLAGIGEVFNTLGVVVHSENLGTILQPLSLIAFSIYLADRFKGSKKIFLHLYILSSPVLIFLVTTSKPQLFPQVLTALALYLTVSEKNINKIRFFLICCLLMGAAQQKLSFILTGGVIGLWALWKASRNIKSVLAIGMMCFGFFFMPRSIWNLGQAINLGFSSFISPLPFEYLEGLSEYRENHYWFPLNLFIPSNFGKVTHILGFQILLLVLVKTKNQKFWEVIALTATGMLATYLFGQSIARSFYEFILWTAVAFSFLPKEEFRFKLCKRFLFIQTVGIFGGAAYGCFILLPGVLSQDLRHKVMLRSASEYGAVDWVNKVLPEDAVVLSQLKSVALYSHKFVPTDWMNYDEVKNRYYDAIKLKNPNFLVINREDLEGFDLAGCVGQKYSGPKSFTTSTRNPFNSGGKFQVTIYRFNSSLMPDCESE